MKTKKLQKNKAFVILFAVMLSSILLAIALGISNIAFKEVRFGNSAKEANDAFFAADVGVECALFYDKTGANNVFTSGSEISMNCAGSSITLTPNNTPPAFWSFDIVGLGSNGKSCVKVTVNKDIIPNTTIISKGYSVNAGGDVCAPSANALERELEVNY